jgi:hypothetical protein
MKIAILGCGPSGLVAAHAAMNRPGPSQVHVFSEKIPSAIYGAQYLHQPIPGITNTIPGHSEPEIIRYRMRGAPESYLRKVYGDAWDGTVSDDLKDQAHVAWDLRSTYEDLWIRYSSLVRSYIFPKNDPAGLVRTVQAILDRYDLVINTIPRPALCLGSHKFVSTQIWALGEMPGRNFPIECEDNIIEYNGDSTPAWYRASRMFGHSTVEWPGHVAKPPLQGVARVHKPLRHNCNCWDGEITHLGRMGRWQNGTLLHHVYADMHEQIILLAEKMEVV